MVYKSSISHSGCGISSYKSSSSVDSKERREEQLSLSLSPSLSHSEGDREIESEKGLFSVESSNSKGMNSKFKGHKKIKLIMSNQEINTKYEKQVGQNLMGSVESLERQVGSVGQPVMDHKSSISHSGCGMRSNKSISSVDPEGKRREQLSLSLSPSLSL